jgi:hypothetical protein
MHIYVATDIPGHIFNFEHSPYLVPTFSIECSFKFPVKVGVEESIVNTIPITDHGSAV